MCWHVPPTRVCPNPCALYLCLTGWMRPARASPMLPHPSMPCPTHPHAVAPCCSVCLPASRPLPSTSAGTGSVAAARTRRAAALPTLRLRCVLRTRQTGHTVRLPAWTACQAILRVWVPCLPFLINLPLAAGSLWPLSYYQPCSPAMLCARRGLLCVAPVMPTPQPTPPHSPSRHLHLLPPAPMRSHACLPLVTPLPWRLPKPTPPPTCIVRQF